MTCIIEFSPKWITSNHFESTLSRSGEPLMGPDMDVHVRIPIDSYIMVDAGVRLLSYLNVLTHVGKTVTLEFEEGDEGTMGYLDRMAFFECLDSRIEVRPARPVFSRSQRFRGKNKLLVEFARIRPGSRNAELPRRLVDSLLNTVKTANPKRVLERPVFTMLSELIENIYVHSNTKLDGFAVSQYYGGKRNEVFIAVSDSGDGPMERLRPVLPKFYPELVGASESDLLVAMFTQGVSRLGKAKGSGLKSAGYHALKFNSCLDVRIPMTYVELRPATGGRYKPKGYVSSGLPIVWGTHISFNFKLDALT